VIGYYVHHQGLGHLQRMRCITACLDAPVTVLSSLAPAALDAAWVRLPMDNLSAVDPTAHGTLHWVPRHDDGLRERMATIASWINTAKPDLLVVDVSVEVATLSRLMGVPTVVMAMRGDRFDRAHRAAYDAADALLAPWAAEFAEPDWPQSWLDKTFHAGAISRFAERSPTPARQHPGPHRGLVLWGNGGGGVPMDRVVATAAATPGWEWRVAGVPPRGTGDLWELLQWADVVVTHGGQGAVAEVAAARRAAVVIAEERPHGEQAATAAALSGAGLAVALPGWPHAAQWPALLDRALKLGVEGLARWAPPDAAQRAAEFIGGTALEVRSSADEPVA
jgi:UDP-N-acetylglucosamine--N-acetylmuramyl-(pentapeptide) pyrophosphoryl-undecaprenol N-acetylglucosamine transferase